jgi:FMN reductase
MAEQALNVMAVSGSLKEASVSRVVVQHVADLMRKAGCTVDLLDLRTEPLPLYSPDTSKKQASYATLQQRVARADVFILGTPDYHGGMSAALKNFLDHFWAEFTGKLFGTIVASHEKGLTATEQIRTVARQCYAWTLPYGISLAEKVDVAEGRIISDALLKRAVMFARDARVYGQLMAQQRQADLNCSDECFLARHRPKR